MFRPLVFFVALTAFGGWLVAAVAKPTVVVEPGPLTFSAAAYEARIEPDGCLTNLKVAGREFLAPGVAISRGSYFFQGGPLKLATLERVSDTVVVASSDTASIQYEFGEHDMNVRLTNKSAEPMVYFFVLAKNVEAIFDGCDEALLVPANMPCKDATFVAGTAKLQIRGGDRLWGPWQGPHQVYEVALQPQETKQLILNVGQVFADERSKIEALRPNVPEPALQIFAPLAYQVFQRSSDAQGTINISGHTTTDADEIQIRVTGKSIDGPLSGEWQSLKLDPATRSFTAQLPFPAGGWYRLEVEALDGDTVLAKATVDKFGIGEVFVGAGQSNSTNCGETRTQQTSGMVSSFGGDAWQLADDPQHGVADNSQGGSFWPAFGDAMFAKYGVPIGVATTGFSGTSVNQWQPDGDLFPWMMTRVRQLGPQGFRALLWHQGEGDIEMPTGEYYAKLRNVIQSSRDQAGWYIPWFVAQASYHNPDKLRFETVRQAQARLWADHVALRGPDTDVLTGDCRDLDGLGIHFSPKGLRLHGQMWAERVGRYMDGEPDAHEQVASAEVPLRFKAEAWPEADALFHRDPEWIGGDDAYSLDLGNERVAWFFGDSFVEPSVAGQRKGSTMIHNSVGIQTGYDPTSADFKAYWQQLDGKPASFIDDEGDEYFWPGGSILLDGKLLMFLMRAHNSGKYLGFDVTGWGAVLIDNLDAAPDQWHVRKLEAPQNDFRALVGSASVVRDGEHLVAFSVGADEHDVYLVRWRLADAAAGELSRPQWWAGETRGWVAQQSLKALPPPIMEHGQTEFSVHYAPQFDRYLQFQFEGFPQSPIGMRSAASLTGPWPAVTTCFRPEEMQWGDTGIMLYAAKAHPEQAANALVLTYATNTEQVAKLFEIPNLYYPRFIRITLSPPAE